MSPLALDMVDKETREEILPIRKDEKVPAPERRETKFENTKDTFTLEDGEFFLKRKLIPIDTTSVGRSVKFRELFTLSGAVASDSTVVTVTAAGSSGAQTDLKSFRFFPNEWHVGMCVRITASGVITDDGTRVVALRIGSGLAATTEWNSMTSSSATVTDSPWHLTWTGIVTTIGSSGTLEAQMMGDINRVNKDDPNTAAVTLNTTTSVIIALTADWDGTTAGNSISVRQWLVEILY